MKDKAKGQLKGNWKWAVLIALINILVLAGLEYLGGKLGKSESIFSIFGVIVLLLAGFIGTNLTVVFLNLSEWHIRALTPTFQRTQQHTSICRILTNSITIHN